jgi:hypothetical protein
MNNRGASRGRVATPRLKAGASSFNGDCLGPRILPRFRSSVPSTSRSDRSGRRQETQKFCAHSRFPIHPDDSYAVHRDRTH